MVAYLTSLLLQCDVASLCIWFRAREICGRTLEDETIALSRNVENQTTSDTLSYHRFTDTTSSVLYILEKLNLFKIILCRSIVTCQTEMTVKETEGKERRNRIRNYITRGL
jgi:hypothetical protein